MNNFNSIQLTSGRIEVGYYNVGYPFYDPIIAVTRGILCEQNVQVLSYHVTNNPSIESIEISVKKNSEVIYKLVSDSLTEMLIIPYGREYDLRGIQMLYDLLKLVIDDAVIIEYE